MKVVELNKNTEIQSLRGIAIISVIAFHTGFPFFSIGYLGVDMFFVISGFLMVQAFESKNKSLIKFYESRIKRILPLYTFILAATLIFFPWVMLDSERWDYYQGLFASAIFLPNVFYYLELGYFNPDALAQPLLHLWSLGVEIQYYFLFPLVYLLCQKFRKSYRLYVFILLFVLSVSVYFLSGKNFAFFIPISRFWEFFLGAFCALPATKLDTTKGTKYCLLILSYLIILLSLLYLKEVVPNERILTVLVCVATANIILLTKHRDLDLLGRVPILIGTGNISYSLYLLHWPVFSGIFYFSGFRPDPLVLALSVPFIFLISILTYNSIEKGNYLIRHAHNPKFSFPQFLTLNFTYITLSLCMLIGLLGHLNKGVLTQYNFIQNKDRPDLIKMAERQQQLVKNEVKLHNDFLNSKARNKIIVMGDSHAVDVFNAVELNKKPYDIGVSFAHFDFDIIEPKGIFSKFDINKTRLWSSGFIKKLENQIVSANFVFISVRWSVNQGYQDWLPVIISQLKEVNANIELILFDNTVEYFYPVPDLWMRYKATDKSITFNSFLSTFSDPIISREVNPKLLRWANENELRIVSKFDLVCSDLYCSGLDNKGNLINYDYGHWTLEGAKFLGKSLINNIL